MFPKIQKKRFIHTFWLFFISTAMIWFCLKRFLGTKWHMLTSWGNLKRFLGTKRRIWVYYNSSWYRLRSSVCGCLHGCCLRSVPARSGASQFAPCASAAVSHETRSHTKCHVQPETRGSVQVQGCCHTVRGYDYMSDNLADDSVASIRCNALTVRRLR